MDIKSPADRSRNMAAIKNRDTTPEIRLRKQLFRLGLRYRVNYKLPGKPDLVFPSKKLAVFVDGCFWHGCDTCYREPDNNREFWRKKIASNKKRDEEVNRILSEKGWKVIRVWEHDISGNLNEAVMTILICM